jgi:beta-lactamase superfamily II metal-dependent hydrolase
MDIHHIDTGRGNCTLIVAPDGTTIMIDAGASNSSAETSSKPRPDASRRPGEWIARYAARHAATDRLDYLIVTHLHPDHMGDIDDATPLSGVGPFRLTGVSDVDHLMPVATLIDRAYPNYQSTPPPTATFTQNYLAYLKYRVEAHRTVQRAIVGSEDQIRLRDPEKYPTFKVRILAANGEVWTRKENKTEFRLPNLKNLPASDQPNENIFSIALRFSYGRFSYFAGGDLTSDTHDGQEPWMDIETPVVHAAGRTEVAAADHHGYFDACGPEFVHSLDAQAYIIQAWDVGHPGSAQLQRMLGTWSGKATHDVFATDLLPANQLTNRRFTPQLRSQRGHVVVRVAPGGDTYQIFVLDSSNEDGIITAAFGRYFCRS